MVDFVALGSALKVVKCPNLESGSVQDSGQGQDFGRIRLGIEVTGHDPRGEGKMPVDHRGAFLASGLGFVVPMGVEEGEGAEIDPGADSGDAVAPMLAARLIGGVAEPEGASVDGRESVLAP